MKHTMETTTEVRPGETMTIKVGDGGGTEKPREKTELTKALSNVLESRGAANSYYEAHLIVEALSKVSPEIDSLKTDDSLKLDDLSKLSSVLIESSPKNQPWYKRPIFEIKRLFGLGE